MHTLKGSKESRIHKLWAAGQSSMHPLFSNGGDRTYSLRHREFLQLQCFLELPLLGRLRPRCLHHSGSGEQAVMQLAYPFVAVRNAGRCRTNARTCADVGYHTFFCMQCTWKLHLCADPDILLEELYTVTGCSVQKFQVSK